METIDLWSGKGCLPKNFTGIATLGKRTKIYYKNGSIHRSDGPAYITEDLVKDTFHNWNNIEQRIFWYKKGKLHRIDGPAYDVRYAHFWCKKWYVNDKLHRLDGPAVESSNGDKIFYLYNKFYFSGEDIPFLLEKTIFLGKEKGKHGLEWMKLMTENGIKEIPILPAARNYLLNLYPRLEHCFNEYGWL